MEKIMDNIDKASQTKQPMSKDTSTFIRLNSFTLRKVVDIQTGKTADLSWAIRNNYPRLILNPDVKAPFDYTTLVTAPFDYISLISLLDKFLGMIEKGEESSLKISCKNVKYVRDNGVSKKTDEKIIQGEVVFGISSKGIAYIACTKQGSEKIAFPVMFDSDWFTIYKNSKEEIKDPKFLSLQFAKNYIETLKKTLSGFVKDSATTTTKLLPKPEIGTTNKNYKNNTVVETTPVIVVPEEKEATKTETPTVSPVEETKEISKESVVHEVPKPDDLDDFLN